MELQEYVVKFKEQQEMREAKNNVFKQKLHVELKLYFVCYNAWNCKKKKKKKNM